MDVETQKDIDEVIQNEVEELFEATLDTIKLKIDQDSTNVNFYSSTHYDVKLRHFIFAKQGSEAANIWNRQSIDGIMSILQTATDARRKLDVVNEMISFVNTKLPQLFITNHEQDNILNEKNQQKFQVQQHYRQPFIVLSHRKDMDDLKQHPDELKLSPKLLYDDAGYFIGISSMNNGQWQPLYNLYDTSDKIYVVIELAGFKQGEARVQVAEEAIIIGGCRVDLKETLTSPTIHHEKIPIGKFKLEIPLQHKIDPETTELKRDEGLFKITCPKKKNIAKFLE
jgi:HSP20 family molecular chaperone IbpA